MRHFSTLTTEMLRKGNIELLLVLDKNTWNYILPSITNKK